MKTLLTLFVGIVIGLFVAAQAKALNLPVIHLPKHVHLDPLALLLVVIFLLAVWNMRGKRIATHKGGKS